MNNNLSITKIITGISKILNITRQALPLYKEVKPMLIKSSNLISNFNQKTQSKNNKQLSTTTPKTNDNNPTFFQ